MHYIIIPLVLILTANLVLCQHRLQRADVVLHTRTYGYHMPFVSGVRHKCAVPTAAAFALFPMTIPSYQRHYSVQ